MKNTIREGFMRIQGGFETQGISLSIDVPEHIYPDFVHCFDEGNEKGAKILEDLYDLYISLSDKQKEILQMSIYENADNLNTVEDIVIMIKCLKRVFLGV
ncbi:MAG: hypothetical protein E7600_08995 [Ruminococcaceae bacterium]|nr:hypothetical protein [Oscillospiraceae bacterium]